MCLHQSQDNPYSFPEVHLIPCSWHLLVIRRIAVNRALIPRMLASTSDAIYFSSFKEPLAYNLHQEKSLCLQGLAQSLGTYRVHKQYFSNDVLVLDYHWSTFLGCMLKCIISKLQISKVFEVIYRPNSRTFWINTYWFSFWFILIIYFRTKQIRRKFIFNPQWPYLNSSTYISKYMY